MINLRYHVVSLAAVFIALALGVIAGTNLINPVVVKNLRSLNIARQKTVESLRQQRDQARHGLDVWDEFGTALMPELTRDALKGQRFFILEQDGIDQDITSAVEDSLTLAGATDIGRVVLTQRWKLAEPASVAKLAADVGTSDTDATSVQRAAAAKIAARLSSSGDPSDGSDILGMLQRDGFLALRGVSPGSFPVRDSMMLYLWSGKADPFPDPSAFALSFLRALPSKMIAVVAEPLDAVASLCDRMRGDAELAKRVAGVDHVDLAPGRFSLISALHDLVAGKPARQYGVRGGATAVVPVVAPS